MPHVFTHAEYADAVFVYGFRNGNALAACREYSLRFPNCRVPDSRVFASVYNKLRETGALPSSHISSECAKEQNVKSKAFFSRQNVVQKAHEEFPHVSVFHIQEHGELYVSTACIIFIYRWCNALKEEMKLDDWICVGG